MGQDARRNFVIGPNGTPLRLADLPLPGTKRWVSRRKAEVVAAVDGGLLSLQEACLRYRLTVEEFVSWEDGLHEHGLAGLKATNTKRFRDEHKQQF